MPRIELRDPFGTSYRIDTFSTWTIQHWLGEWLPRLFPPEFEGEEFDPLVTVWPLFQPDNKNPDWPADTRFIGEPFRIPRDPAAAMIALGKRHRELIEMIEAANVAARA